MGGSQGKILFVAAGAVGSVIGGFLRQAGYAVTLLGRKPHLQAIAREGLEVGYDIGRFESGRDVLPVSELPDPEDDLV